MKPLCLTIAGSDPSSGAGIQADIRTFDRCGVYPFSVITALTYQSASKFYGLRSLSDDLDDQLKALFDNYSIKHVKIGMIPDTQSLDIIIKYIQEYDLRVVLDPLTISSAGARLTIEGMENELEKRLFPLVSVLTPNIHEAAFYTNMDLARLKLNDNKRIEEAAELLLKKLYLLSTSNFKEKAVVIKSAGIDNDVIFDLLCMTESQNSIPSFHLFKKPKLSLHKNVHGTGCVFSSAIAAYLAKDYTIFDAVKSAETFFDEAFQNFIQLPEDGYVIDIALSDDRLKVIEQVKEIYSYLSRDKSLSRLIPEVRMNISGALPNATEKADIAAFEGRITVIEEYPYALGDIKFGVSDHTARLILTAKEFDNSINFVMNLKYKKEWVEKLIQSEKLLLQEIRREEQPKSAAEKEYSTMQWLIKESIKTTGKIADIIWDKGSIGKEPMLRLFSKDSKEMIAKVAIIKELLLSS